MRKIIIYFIIMFLIILIFAGVFTPILLFIQNYSLYLIIHRLLGFTCHQIVERCFYILNFPMGICCRCTGIYIGAILTLCFLFNKTKYITWKLILFILVLGLSEKGVEKFILYTGNNLLRFISGAFLGIGIALIIINLLLFIDKFLKRRKGNEKNE